MNTSTLDRTLRELAAAPVSAADLDALEARVLASIAADTTVALAGRRRRRATPLVVGTVAACLLGLAVLATGWFAGGDDPFVLAAAVDVEVVLPGGDVVAGTAGLELPVGSLLSVGGSMEIGGTTYGPGDYVITPDGPAVAAPGGGGGPPEPGVGDEPRDPVVPAATTTSLPIRTDAAPPPAGPSRPTTSVRPATQDGSGDTRPATTVRDRPPPTSRPPERDTSTTAPATSVPPDHGAPPADATVAATTEPPRDARPQESTTTAPPRDRATTTTPRRRDHG